MSTNRVQFFCEAYSLYFSWLEYAYTFSRECFCTCRAASKLITSDDSVWKMRELHTQWAMQQATHTSPCVKTLHFYANGFRFNCNFKHSIQAQSLRVVSKIWTTNFSTCLRNRYKILTSYVWISGNCLNYFKVTTMSLTR